MVICLSDPPVILFECDTGSMYILLLSWHSR